MSCRECWVLSILTALFVLSFLFLSSWSCLVSLFSSYFLQEGPVILHAQLPFPMAGSAFIPLLPLLPCFPLSLVLLLTFSCPLNSAAITIDKPQVCVHKLRPVFLYSLFFSAVLHELSVLEVFSSGLCFAVWAQQVSFTWALGWLCLVGALGSKAQWFPVWNSVGCDVAGAAGLTAPSPRIHPPAMKMCK